MIGNDIIDLQLAVTQSDWQRKGLLTKIFTDDEQKFILNSENPFQNVWLLWSMKESAYKAHVQQYLRRFFNPKKLVCKLKNNKEGIVIINETKYITKTQQTKDWIHTVATQKKIKISNECFQFSKTNDSLQNLRIHQKLLAEVAELKRVPSESLQLRKNKFGVPKVYQNGGVLTNSISLSHHGRFGAFAISN